MGAARVAFRAGVDDSLPADGRRGVARMARARLAGARGVLSLYVVQLAANAMWTWLFFVWRQGAIAFVEILALWLLVAATIVSFARMHRMAAALLAPYLTWVTFATALCYSCWKLNPDCCDSVSRRSRATLCVHGARSVPPALLLLDLRALDETFPLGDIAHQQLLQRIGRTP
jgi:hypothetical protein